MSEPACHWDMADQVKPLHYVVDIKFSSAWQHLSEMIEEADGNMDLANITYYSPVLLNKYQLILKGANNVMWMCLLMKTSVPPVAAYVKVKDAPGGNSDTSKLMVSKHFPEEGSKSFMGSWTRGIVSIKSWVEEFCDEDLHVTLTIREARMPLDDNKRMVAVLKRHLVTFNNPELCDVCFSIARRGRGPVRIYATSSVLCGIEYYATLLGAGFAESDMTDGGTDTEVKDTETCWADDDSDAEDDEGMADDVNGQDTVKQRVTGPGYRTIRVTDTSPRTFRAFLLYLYTGSAEFYPLKSEFESNNRRFSSYMDEGTEEKIKFHQWRRQQSAISPSSVLHGYDARTSPKSLYRLAHKLDIADLKTVCAEQVAFTLTSKTVFTELSGPFFDTFSTELRHAYYRCLRSNADSVMKQDGIWKQVLSTQRSAKAMALIGDALGGPRIFGIGDEDLDI